MSIRALRELDLLDRQIAVALQHDGRASWRAVAQAVGSSAATVARHGQQLLESGVVKVNVSAALGSTGQIDSFLIRINCRPGAQIEVAAELVNNPDIRFLTVVTGRYDIIAELVVHGGATHYPQVIANLQSIDGVERWRSDLLMHLYKVTFDWGSQLLVEPTHLRGLPASPSAFAGTDPCSPSHFDSVDWKIIEALRDDGRASLQGIADRIGTNESSVRRRFERLRSEGCVSIWTLVAAPALGMGAETLMTVRVAPHRLEAVAHKLAQHPSVRYLAATLDDNSLFCEIIVPSTNDLHNFITSTLARLDGVEGWSASMEILFLKRGFVETPWWRSQVSFPPAIAQDSPAAAGLR